MLYQLSYAGLSGECTGLERETGIEPATNSLEGCDSTIELLPRWIRDHLRGEAVDRAICTHRRRSQSLRMALK